jgi:hypothetical protein
VADKLGVYEFEAPVILYYSDLFVPKSYMENGVAKGAPKYKMQVIIHNNDPQLAALKALAVQVAAEGGFENAGERFKLDKKAGGLSHPFTPGSKIIDAAAAKGKDVTKIRALLANTTIFRATSARQPRLYAPVAGLPVLTTDEKFFYTGALVLPVVYLNAFEGMGGGVNAYVNDILAIPGGERLASEAKVPTTWAGKIPVSVDADASF